MPTMLATVGLVLILAGCGGSGSPADMGPVNGGDPANGDPANGGAMGNTPVLSGQVVTVQAEPNGYYAPTITFSPYAGPALTVTGGGWWYGVEIGTGTISATGQLRFQLAPISENYLGPIDDVLERILEPWMDEGRVVFNPPTGIRADRLDLEISGPGGNELLDYSVTRATVSASGHAHTGFTLNAEEVHYIFVTNDVTITAEEVEFSPNAGTTIMGNRFNMTLRAGWNAVHLTASQTGSLSDGVKMTFSVFHRDRPTMPWVIGGIPF